MRLMQRLPLATLSTVGEHIIQRMHERSEGGLCYGLDWHTAAICFPRLTRLFKLLESEYKLRKEADCGQ